MPEIPLPILTERLVLRRFTADDLTAYHAYRSLEETARFLPSGPHKITTAMQVVGKYSNFVFEQVGDWVSLAVEAKGSPVLLGEVVLKWLPGRGQGEVGWILAPAGRGKGYATEAAEAMLKLGFETLGMHRIEARLDALNGASAAVCQRLGMQHEATLRENSFANGVRSSEARYAILASEWKSSH
ncbi:GNAT family N-acetyltransferase [Pseudarthrobacter sp. J1738]|uniref:GNAT family N-acetyltransferase n=1 Tax=Pseudarthrobacter sp. J1738 TaxID=3420446 RepID=UPI003D2C7530